MVEVPSRAAHLACAAHRPKHLLLLRGQAVSQLGNMAASSYAGQMDDLARASSAAMAQTMGEVACCLTDFEQRLQCESARGSVFHVEPRCALCRPVASLDCILTGWHAPGYG